MDECGGQLEEACAAMREALGDSSQASEGREENGETRSQRTPSTPGQKAGRNTDSKARPGQSHVETNTLPDSGRGGNPPMG